MVYVTPLAPGAFASMSADEQQSHQDTLNRVSLRPHSPTFSATLNGGYVTPMPPQLRTNTSGSISHGAAAEQSGSCEVQEQTANSRSGGSGREIHQPRDLEDGGTCHEEQAGASWQGNESLQATAFQPVSTRKRGNNKRRRRKAWVKAANTDTEHLLTTFPGTILR